MRTIATLSVVMLLSPFIFAQSGAAGNTLYYRFDGTVDPLCNTTQTTDCVSMARFWYHDPQGQRVIIAEPRTFTNLGNGLLEATAPVPALAGRYHAGLHVLMTHVGVAADGSEVEAVPLGTLYAKRPKQGVEAGIR